MVDSAVAAAKKRSVSAKKTTTKTASSKRTSSKKVVAKKRTSTAKRRTTTRRARAVRRRAPTRAARFRGQQSPSTARLLEIQHALQEGGFLTSEPSGKWDEASTSAMKRFQEEHDITPSGKINALSLIALGLGPKRGPAPGTTSVLATPSTPDSTTEPESNERK